MTTFAQVHKPKCDLLMVTSIYTWFTLSRPQNHLADKLLRVLPNLVRTRPFQFVRQRTVTPKKVLFVTGRMFGSSFYVTCMTLSFTRFSRSPNKDSTTPQKVLFPPTVIDCQSCTLLSDVDICDVHTSGARPYSHDAFASLKRQMISGRKRRTLSAT